ncbi:hypothetical protein IG193_01655 [Infirmifilum lucidum]|uniref:Uncharacterized protein n=1 Tax=Infirmifilum lucidum TaxID=2776706 RepID=A0A7L9FJJ8_9CREN|nr:hypothetical protein [Infirmifilum lucidum]QOJ79193.1 hypothetical protein IG193_01655 [Infirmifilum lucidum]
MMREARLARPLNEFDGLVLEPVQVIEGVVGATSWYLYEAFQRQDRQCEFEKWVRVARYNASNLEM